MGAIYSEPEKYTVSTQTPLTQSQLNLCNVIPPEVVREQIILMTSQNNSKREQSGCCFKNQKSTSPKLSETDVRNDDDQKSDSLNEESIRIRLQQEKQNSKQCCCDKKHTYPPPLVRSTISRHSKISDLLHSSLLGGQLTSSKSGSSNCCPTNTHEGGPKKREGNTCACANKKQLSLQETTMSKEAPTDNKNIKQCHNFEASRQREMTSCEKEEDKNLSDQNLARLEDKKCKIHDMPKTMAQAEECSWKKDKNLNRQKSLSVEQLQQVSPKEIRKYQRLSSSKTNEQDEKPNQIDYNATICNCQAKQKSISQEEMPLKGTTKDYKNSNGVFKNFKQGEGTERPSLQNANGVCKNFKQGEVEVHEEEKENIFQRSCLQNSSGVCKNMKHGEAAAREEEKENIFQSPTLQNSNGVCKNIKQGEAAAREEEKENIFQRPSLQNSNGVCKNFKQDEAAARAEEEENIFQRPCIQKSISHESFLKKSTRDNQNSQLVDSCKICEQQATYKNLRQQSNSCSSKLQKTHPIDNKQCNIHDVSKTKEKDAIMQMEQENDLRNQKLMPLEKLPKAPLPQLSNRRNEQQHESVNVNFCSCTVKQKSNDFYSKVRAEDDRYSNQEVICKSFKQGGTPSPQVINANSPGVKKSTSQEMLAKTQPKQNINLQKRDNWIKMDQKEVTPKLEQKTNVCSCSYKQELMTERKMNSAMSSKSNFEIISPNEFETIEQENLENHCSSAQKSSSQPIVSTSSKPITSQATSSQPTDSENENLSKMEQDVKFCNCPIKREMKQPSTSNSNTSSTTYLSCVSEDVDQNQINQQKLINEVIQPEQTMSATFKNSRSKSFSNEANTNKFNNFDLECLNEHNRFRALHNSPPLQLCSKLCQLATTWANNISRSKTIRRDDQNKFGENMYIAINMNIHGCTPVQSWYNEISKYDFQNPSFHPNSGHFTQVIWKDTKEIGVGMVTKDKTTWVVVYYNPPGNLVNKFNLNVPPLVE